MKRLLVAMLAASLLLTAPVFTPAQAPQTAFPVTVANQPLVTKSAEAITTAQLKDYLSFIASDEMEGRQTPSRGLDLTAKFLSTELSRFGAKPAGDDGSFIQRIALRREKIVAGGFPMAGGLGGRADVMSCMAAGVKAGKKRAYVGGTLTANPMTCAAGYFAIKEIIENDAAKKAGENFQIFHRRHNRHGRAGPRAQPQVPGHVGDRRPAPGDLVPG
jgi:hypothetical protein